MVRPVPKQSKPTSEHKTQNQCHRHDPCLFRLNRAACRTGYFEYADIQCAYIFGNIDFLYTVIKNVAEFLGLFPIRTEKSILCYLFVKLSG